MAHRQHLEVLEQGVDVWNEWRLKHPTTQPDLSCHSFGSSPCHPSRMNLCGINLKGADLIQSNFSGADLINADLTDALFYEAIFAGANFSGATLIGADLNGVDLSNTKFKGTDLSGANLISANLSGADLSQADLSGAWFGYTTLCDMDLSTVKGLDAVVHQAPSSVGVDTIFRSKGNIPEIFLRGCGLPEEFITYMRSLTAHPIQFCSCFISYSSKDQEFAERLYADLQAKGVRVWFAPHDLPVGARIRPAIDESIRVHDKLLLVLSEASVNSQWVEQEVETALARERGAAGMTVLFPIRIDDAVMGSDAGWPALIKHSRNIGDFTRWRDHDSYAEAFSRLLRDLQSKAHT